MAAPDMLTAQVRCSAIAHAAADMAASAATIRAHNAAHCEGYEDLIRKRIAEVRQGLIEVEAALGAAMAGKAAA